MTTLASDDFNRGDNTDLGANWSTIDSAIGIVSNELQAGTLSADSCEIYTGISWPNDHWSQVTIKNPENAGTVTGYGACVRGNTSGSTYYRAMGSVAGLFISRRSGGTGTTLVSRQEIFYKFNHNDVLRFEARGNFLIVLRNGEFLYAVQDSVIASGSPGVIYSSTLTAVPSADDWSGGNTTGEVGFAGNMIAGTLAGIESSCGINQFSLPEPGLITDVYAYSSDSGAGSHGLRAFSVDVLLSLFASGDDKPGRRNPDISHEHSHRIGVIPTYGVWQRHQLINPKFMPGGAMCWFGIGAGGGGGICELGRTTVAARSGHAVIQSGGLTAYPVQLPTALLFGMNTTAHYNIVVAYKPMTINTQPSVPLNYDVHQRMLVDTPDNFQAEMLGLDAWF